MSLTMAHAGPLTNLMKMTSTSEEEGQGHAEIACYLGLYKEGDVKHINGPTHPFLT